VALRTRRRPQRPVSARAPRPHDRDPTPAHHRSAPHRRPIALASPMIVTVAALTNQINPTRPRPTESARSTAPEQPYVVIPAGGQQFTGTTTVSACAALRRPRGRPHGRPWAERRAMIFPSLNRSLVHPRPFGSADVGCRSNGAGRDVGDGARMTIGRPRKRERSAQRRSRSTSQAPSAGHRPRRAGRVKGGAVRGPRTPHGTVATRCPPGTRDPTTATSRAASTRKPGRSRVRAMSVRYDPAFHGQPRQLPAALASRSAPVPRLPVGFPS
jgi:hypothetical protein